MNALKKFGYVAWISAQSNVAYFGETLGRFVFLGIILFTFLRLWELTYRTMGSAQLGGLTLPEMMWLTYVTSHWFGASSPSCSRARNWRKVSNSVLNVSRICS